METGTPEQSALVMRASSASAVTSVVDGLNWFRPEPGEEEGAGQLEMDLWLQEFLPHVTRSCGKAQQLLQVNLLWRQPVLLKVPKNYDDIFQVSEFSFAGSLRRDRVLNVFLHPSVLVLSQAKVRRLPQRPQGSDRVSHVWNDGVSEGGLLQDRSEWRG